jgi:hypothetical protein
VCASADDDLHRRVGVAREAEQCALCREAVHPARDDTRRDAYARVLARGHVGPGSGADRVVAVLGREEHGAIRVGRMLAEGSLQERVVVIGGDGLHAEQGACCEVVDAGLASHLLTEAGEALEHVDVGYAARKQIRGVLVEVCGADDRGAEVGRAPARHDPRQRSGQGQAGGADAAVRPGLGGEPSEDLDLVGARPLCHERGLRAERRAVAPGVHHGDDEAGVTIQLDGGAGGLVGATIPLIHVQGRQRGRAARSARREVEVGCQPYAVAHVDEEGFVRRGRVGEGKAHQRHVGARGHGLHVDLSHIRRSVARSCIAGTSATRTLLARGGIGGALGRVAVVRACGEREHEEADARARPSDGAMVT